MSICQEQDFLGGVVWEEVRGPHQKSCTDTRARNILHASDRTRNVSIRFAAIQEADTGRVPNTFSRRSCAVSVLLASAGVICRLPPSRFKSGAQDGKQQIAGFFRVSEPPDLCKLSQQATHFERVHLGIQAILHGMLECAFHIAESNGRLYGGCPIPICKSLLTAQNRLYLGRDPRACRKPPHRNAVTLCARQQRGRVDAVPQKIFLSVL